MGSTLLSRPLETAVPAPMTMEWAFANTAFFVIRILEPVHGKESGLTPIKG